MPRTLAALPWTDEHGAMTLTDAELAYLRSQPPGRLATVGPDGGPPAGAGQLSP